MNYKYKTLNGVLKMNAELFLTQRQFSLNLTHRFKHSSTSTGSEEMMVRLIFAKIKRKRGRLSTKRSMSRTRQLKYGNQIYSNLNATGWRWKLKLDRLSTSQN